VGVVFSAGAIATQKRKEGKNTLLSKTSKICLFKTNIYNLGKLIKYNRDRRRI